PWRHTRAGDKLTHSRQGCRERLPFLQRELQPTFLCRASSTYNRMLADCERAFKSHRGVSSFGFNLVISQCDADCCQTCSVYTLDHPVDLRVPDNRQLVGNIALVQSCPRIDQHELRSRHGCDESEIPPIGKHLLIDGNLACLSSFLIEPL